MKFTHLSRVYLDDVEYFELLSTKNIAHGNLLKLARSRGLVFSLRAENEDVRGKLASLPSDWTTVSRILEDMARPDPAERKTSVHVTNCVPGTDVPKLAAHAKKERGRDDEAYNVTKISDDTTRLEVTYTEVDYSKAVPYQRRERKLYVDVTTAGETVSFRYTANDRAKQIVQVMQSQLQYKDDAKAEVAAISLFAVRDAATRTKFFTDLIKDIEDYKYQNTTHVNVDMRFPKDDDEDLIDEETADQKKKKAKAAEKVKGLVNKMSLSGEQVLAAELYQQASDSGYYICNISWSCENKKDSRFHIDCEAGFSDPVKADQFTFDVTRYWRFKAENPDSEETVKLSDADRRKLAALLEEAAFRAYNKVAKGAKKPAKKAKE